MEKMIKVKKWQSSALHVCILFTCSLVYYVYGGTSLLCWDTRMVMALWPRFRLIIPFGYLLHMFVYIFWVFFFWVYPESDVRPRGSLWWDPTVHGTPCWCTTLAVPTSFTRDQPFRGECLYFFFLFYPWRWWTHTWRSRGRKCNGE